MLKNIKSDDNPPDTIETGYWCDGEDHVIPEKGTIANKCIDKSIEGVWIEADHELFGIYFNKPESKYITKYVKFNENTNIY
jgi:hypothetical protein